MKNQIKTTFILASMLQFAFPVFGQNALRKAPDFELTDLKGRLITLSSLEGKVVIVDVWDTWCPPCRMEIPDFIDLHNRFKLRGFVMIGVALGNEGEQAVRSFVKDNQIRYKVAMATRPFLKDYGPNEGIPTTYVIDKKGFIAATYVGYREKAVFEEDILRLLKE